MGISEAKKVNNKKYNDNKTTVYTIRCMHNTDSDIINRLNSMDNKAGYIKQLIRKDIERDVDFWND